MTELPKAIFVKEVLKSRYADNDRPQNWDQRCSGIDTIIASDGNQYNLFCDGQQSTPKPGWQIVLNSGDNRAGFEWTLYGMPS
jgi:hypothetical protein